MRTVKGTLLQGIQPQRDSRPEFLESRLDNFFRLSFDRFPAANDFFVLFLEYISVVPHEDIITLIVEGHDASTPELGILMEKGRELPPDTMTQTSVETIQDELWAVVSGTATVADVFAGDGRYHAETGSRSFR